MAKSQISAPLRIAFFVDAFPDLSVTFIINQITGLLQRGHHITIYAQSPGRAIEEHQDVGKWGLRKHTVYVGPDVPRFRRLVSLMRILFRHPTRLPLLVRTLPPFARGTEARSLRYLTAASALIDAEPFDVIHCHFGPNGNVAALLQKLGIVDSPIVTTFHGYDMRRGVTDGGAGYEPLRRHGDRFLAISGYNRSLLEEWGFPADRIRRHPVGIDLELFAFRGVRAPGSPTVQLVTVANLVAVKGHVHLVEAIARLRQAQPSLDVCLRLVGEGDQRDRLESVIAQRGLSDRVVLLGGLERDRVLQELREADLFVLPSLAEATPVALMEAQAVGIPVLATDVGAVREVVRDGESGLIVPPGSAGALAEGLARLIETRDRWGEMGRRGREHVEQNYDIRRLVMELEDIYREVATR